MSHNDEYFKPDINTLKWLRDGTLLENRIHNVGALSESGQVILRTLLETEIVSLNLRQGVPSEDMYTQLDLAHETELARWQHLSKYIEKRIEDSGDLIMFPLEEVAEHVSDIIQYMISGDHSLQPDPDM